MFKPESGWLEHMCMRDNLKYGHLIVRQILIDLIIYVNNEMYNCKQRSRFG